MIEKKNDLLEVRSDRLFTDLFNENEMNTIEWVAMQILECSYEDVHGKVTVGNARLSHVKRNERSKYVDLIIKLSDEEQILIELNNRYNGNYLRNVLYAFNMISNNFNTGETNYELTRKRIRVILVNLNWHDYKPKEVKEIIELPYPSDKVDGYLLKIINLNLDCYDKFCYNEVDYVDRLAKLLTITDKDEMQDIINQEGMLKSYYNKLSYLSDDNKYREEIMNENIEKNMEIIDSYNDGLNDGWHKGIQEGIEQGFEQGIEQNKKEMLLNMYNKNLTISEISDLTGLNIEEIEKIISNR